MKRICNTFAPVFLILHCANTLPVNLARQAPNIIGRRTKAPPVASALTLYTRVTEQSNRTLDEPSAEGCVPTCRWTCGGPSCDETCEPVCAPPQCMTACTKPTNCYERCDKPTCAVICPQHRCANGFCPKCITVCKKVQCKTECAAKCESRCQEPICTYKCKPGKCEKPMCTMRCGGRQTCGFKQDLLMKRPVFEKGMDVLEKRMARLPKTWPEMKKSR